jgi:hypothetical protein
MIGLSPLDLILVTFRQPQPCKAIPMISGLPHSPATLWTGRITLQFTLCLVDERHYMYDTQDPALRGWQLTAAHHRILHRAGIVPENVICAVVLLFYMSRREGRVHFSFSVSAVW